MQSACTAPLNKLETHYAVYYANCTLCASEKKLCSIQNTLCIMQKASCICMHHSECKQIFWLRRCHMKVSAYFAQGKRNEWEFSRCPCLNSFFSKLTYARTLKWTLLVKIEHIPQSILFTFYGGKNSVLWRGLLEFAITAIREIFCGINIWLLSHGREFRSKLNSMNFQLKSFTFSAFSGTL